MSDESHPVDEAPAPESTGRSAGITEEMVEATLGDLGDPRVEEILGSTTLAALRLADVMAGFFPQVSPEFFDELKAEFTEGQILELGAALSVASGWQRMIEAFGIRPDSPQEVRDLR